MHRTALILAAGAAAILAPLGAAAPARAGSYTTQHCHNFQDSPPGASGGWSTVIGGSTLSSNAAPAAWTTECSRYRNNVGNWAGVGGAFGDNTAAGSFAFAKFVPPAGSTITYVRGLQDRVITSGAYAEAGLFAASSGRSITDNSLPLSGEGVSRRGDAGYTAQDLGADGAQGILIGSRCPTSLPDITGGYCGGAGTSISQLEITIEDPSPSVVDASIALDGSGRATLTWSASDPQSGLAAVTIARSGGATATVPTSCNAATAPRCQPSASGSTTVQLAEGETATFTVTGDSVGGQADGSKTVSVTRPRTAVPTPTPPPTTPTPGPVAPTPTPTPVTPPPTTPPSASKVSLKTKVLKGRRVKLSGSAKGCKRVSIKVPGRKKRATAAVRRGKWSVTVSRKRGTYRATCGSETAKRTVR